MQFTARGSRNGQPTEITWADGTLSGDPLAVALLQGEARGHEGEPVGPPAGPYTDSNHLKSPISTIELIQQFIFDIEEMEGDDVPVPEEIVGSSGGAPMAVDDDEDNEKDRTTLIAEILVLLFGEHADDVAEELIGHSDQANGVALATPVLTKRYGKKPGPNWVSGGVSRLGTPVWLWTPPTGGGGGAPPPSPSPAPTPPPTPPPARTAPSPAPTPPGPPTGQPAALPGTPRPFPFTPVPVPAHTGRGGTQAKAVSTQAYNDAMAKLSAGQALSNADKVSLARKLTNMPVDLLRKLHGALTGTHWAATQLANQKAAVTAVKGILTGGSPAPTLTPTPAPTLPKPTYVAKTGTVAKSTTSETWETGKPKPGTLNGVDFAPAPPKFWEKVKDVDVKEPPPMPGKKVDRVGVMIQEPDGRVWIVSPTNAFGGRNHTIPGGTVEPGLTDQQNALKEVWEETGLQVEITGFVGDFEDSNTKKNGRLYIGKRVGGAPWDAKIESHIISHKTGKASAESEEVKLVPPEEAAKLLHRTDDLAQLAMIHPISLDTKPDGNVIDKIVRGLESKVKQYETKKKAAGEATGDSTLHHVQETRGFNKKPTVVNKSDFDNLMSKGGHIELLRGIASIPPSSSHGRSTLTPEEMAEQFRTGDHFPGHGMYGVGTYADATKGHANVATSTYSGGGTVIRMALPKTAKIVKFSELKRKTPSHPKNYTVPIGKSRTDYWRGIHAALAGYDAIEVDATYNGNSYYVILNRGILTVQDKAPSKGYRIS